MDTPTISIDLDQARIAAGITEEQLAEATGIARTTLRRKLRAPGSLTVSEFIRVTRAIGVPADALKVAS